MAFNARYKRKVLRVVEERGVLCSERRVKSSGKGQYGAADVQRTVRTGIAYEGYAIARRIVRAQLVRGAPTMRACIGQMNVVDVEYGAAMHRLTWCFVMRTEKVINYGPKRYVNRIGFWVQVC